MTVDMTKRGVVACVTTALVIVLAVVVGCGGGGGGDTNENGNNNNDSSVLCGDGELTGLEECDDGEANSDTEPDACRADCTLPHCWDGVIDTGESCDDGSQNSDIVPGACRTDCTAPRCGDGVVDVGLGELCDDGAALPTETCNTSCLVIFCGNGLVEGDEACDDGNVVAGDGCSPDCSSNEQCGNGIVDGINHEECDDGAANSDSAVDACRTDCRMAHCGDGVLDASEICDDGAGNADAADVSCRTDCQPQRCGDGVTDLVAGELCDDGNLVSDDGCSGDCLSEEWCGNGYVDFALGEQCDDGDLQSRDGCDSRCLAELPSWEEVSFPPLGQFQHTMVYDAARAEMMIYGLASDSYIEARTWTLTGQQWLLRQPAQTPPLRLRQAMVYDSHRERVVMFGGDFHTQLADTWEWDGTTWAETTPASSPSPRTRAAMGYDPVRHRAVLFGGNDGSQSLSDTWEYDGSTWVQITTGSSPPATDGAALIWDGAGIVLYADYGAQPNLWDYNGASWTPRAAATEPWGDTDDSVLAADPSTGEILLFQTDWGGGSGSPETWLYSGGNWQLVTGTVQPAPRNNHAMAFDSAQGRYFLFGGSESGLPMDDTWSFHSGSWTPEQVSHVPVGRTTHTQAFHGAAGQLLVVGGLGGQNSDTWTFDGMQWRYQAPAPYDVSYGSAVYDAGNGVVLLFGGYSHSSSIPFNELWEWDGTSWAAGTNTNPPPARENANLAYDSARGVTVLFGGDDDPAITTATMFDDTWEYDGTSWTEVSPSPAPTPRTFASMGYDPVRQRVVLFGGTDSALSAKNDTWEYDGSTWVQVTTSSSPPAGSGASLIYDPNRERMVLFPSSFAPVPNPPVWEYDGMDWTEISVPNHPSSRLMYRVSYDSWRRQFLLFSGNQQLSDLWTFAWQSATPLEACSGGTDEDWDGLVDCADPDCAGAVGCP